MKSLLVIGLLVLSTQVFAQVQSVGGKFHLLNMKCEGANENSAEASPQSPPLDVDDPGTPGCNRWEINILTSGDFSKEEQHLETLLLDLNYGIGDNLQLKYEVPMEKTQKDSASETNIGHSKIGIKYLFFEDESSDTQIGFYPQIEMVTPGASQSSSQVEVATGNIVILPFLLSTKVGAVKKGDVMMTANVGYNASSRADTESSVFVLTGIGFPILRNLSVMGEISSEEAVAKGVDGVREELVKLNVGMVGTINKHFLLYGSLGESLVSSDHLNHTYALAGFRVLTGALGE